MTKKKSIKKSVIISILVILLGAGAIAAAFSYAFSIRKPEYFVLHKRTLATRMYDEIMNFDYYSQSPDDPEKILDINNKINLLIYGDMLLNYDLLGNLLTHQRLLYAPALLDTISYNDQYENLISGLEAYKAEGIICYDITTQPPRRHPDYDDIITARVVWQTSVLGVITWEYVLEEDENGKIRILSFTPSRTPE